MYVFFTSGTFSYLLRENLLQRRQVWEPFSNTEGVIERRAVSRASDAIGQQRGNEGRYSMTVLASNLYSQERWGQGVCHSPRISCCTFKAENTLWDYLRYCCKLLFTISILRISILLQIVKHNIYIYAWINPVPGPWFTQ